MRIGITCDLREEWPLRPDDPHDAAAEFDKPETLAEIAAALEAAGHVVERIGNAEAVLRRLDDLREDLIFNICEGREGRNRESQVPLLLEMRGMPFVGSDALTMGLTLDKVLAKKCFLADGIPTPPFVSVETADDLAAVVESLDRPWFVKPRWEGTSKGLTDASCVETPEALERQVERIRSLYRQPALVESFIRGTEFTVAVLGNRPPRAMPVVQVGLDGRPMSGGRFYTFELIEDSRLGYLCPARIPPGLERILQECAVRAYRSVGCRDLGRVDFRVDERGRPYVLEVNPLPFLGRADVFGIFPPVIGRTYESVIQEIVEHAAFRCGLRGPVSAGDRVG